MRSLPGVGSGSSRNRTRLWRRRPVEQERAADAASMLPLARRFCPELLEERQTGAERTRAACGARVKASCGAMTRHGTPRKCKRLLRGAFGSQLDPHSPWMIARSMETPTLTMRRAAATAGRIAHWLADNPVR